MKKCPVCGVMMGDNVARCSMCKYDFQKASLGGDDTQKAIAEAESNFKAKEAENAERVAARKSEEEKQLQAIKERITREINELSSTYEAEREKLEKEYQEMQKQALADKAAIDAELETERAEVENARNYSKKIKADADSEAEATRAQAQKEYDEMLNLAKEEQQKIISEAQQQTEALAVQVEKEFTEAMAKRDEILGEAKELQDFVNNADQIKAEREAELNELDSNIKILREDYVTEQARIEQEFAAQKAQMEEESKRLAEEQAAESLRLREQAEAERKAIDEEKEAIIADIEQRRTDAQLELDQLVEQAKSVIAEAEEATKVRDEMNVIIEEAKASEITKAENEKIVLEYQSQAQEWVDKISELQGDYNEAQKIIEESKTAPIQAEALAQEIILMAEKQSVSLKEAALSESEKGSIQKILEEKEQKIKEMEMEREEFVAKIEQMQNSIASLEAQMNSGSSNFEKEYAVEVVPHTATAEVDYKGVQKVLSSKASQGWKLVNMINDEGGKLQSALGGAETGSLSGGTYNSKEDRVILIFERNITKS